MPGYWKNLNTPGFLLITSLLLCFWSANGQTQRWYFGDKAGVDFAANPPQAIDGPIQTNEGCAVVTNNRGRVVFSTDGEQIYDPSGSLVFSGLEGDISSTHSAIIVPHPAEPCGRFFVFTVGSAEDQSLNSGLHVVEVTVSGGSINVSASRRLHTHSTEKLAATPDGRGGYWVVSHDYIDTARANDPRGRRFYAYHVTYPSVLASLRPIISTTGTVHAGASPFGGTYWNSIGQMKFNQEGDRLALALYAEAVIDILRFDKNTGRFYYMTRLNQFQQAYPGTNVYGIEFSPSGNVLYASTGYVNPGQMGHVWAFNLSILSSNTIWNNRNDIALALSTPQNKYPFGALQTAPDGAIYIARNGEPYLDKIEEPDNFQNPAYIPEAIILTDTCKLGLPTAIKSADCSNGAWPCSYFKVDISVDTAVCAGDSIPLGFDSIPGYLYRWNTGSKRSRIYGKAGQEYRVGVTDTAGCYATSFFTIPLARSVDELDLPTDTFFCKERVNTMSFAYPGITYKWVNGSTLDYSFEETENVDIEFYSGCDTLRHTINAQVSDCSCEILVPSAFSPNNDLVNDHYVLKAPCPLEYFHIEIYNRWGVKVFESYDINRSWNGRVFSEPAKPDTYVYKLEYESPQSDPVYLQGAVTVIR